ncbi:MAG: phytochrome-like protein cph2 [Frankiales bacterium]|nr:phytochrome-like protein cph2 [Frankiales bacterium]
MRISGQRVLVLALALAATVALLTVAVVLGRPLAGWFAGAAIGVLVALLLTEHLALMSAWRQLAREHHDTGALQGRLDAAAATSGGWLYTLDTNSRFVYSSDASMDCLGFLPEELLGTEASALLSPDELGLIESRLGHPPQGVNTLVVRGRHRNGEDRWLECSIAAVVDATTKAPIGWTGTARLLTNAKHPGIFREIHRRDVTEILRTEQLIIAFQPIIDLTTGFVIGVEALSRFPSRPAATPDVLFAEAANAGLGPDLELLAIRRALEEARVLDSSLHVAVNVSPTVLASPSLIDALLASGMDLARVIVEITEHASVVDYTVLEHPRKRLRDLGVRLAIDDAGSGYASLRHIVALAPDVIKIDRALVTDLNCDRARRALVGAVVSFANEIGATTVIGEGVETQAELDALIALGVDAAQGYFIGRPTPSPSEWLHWDSSSAVSG